MESSVLGKFALLASILSSVQATPLGKRKKLCGKGQYWAATENCDDCMDLCLNWNKDMCRQECPDEYYEKYLGIRELRDRDTIYLIWLSVMSCVVLALVLIKMFKACRWFRLKKYKISNFLLPWTVKPVQTSSNQPDATNEPPATQPLMETCTRKEITCPQNAFASADTSS
uniref:TNFR-Cys domain-containing protein n=1 Tax=Ciona savignyi TaxID=51511 RepID=H2YAW9_CIOSA